MATAERKTKLPAWIPVVLTIESNEELWVVKRALADYRRTSGRGVPPGAMPNTDGLIAVLKDFS